MPAPAVDEALTASLRAAMSFAALLDIGFAEAGAERVVAVGSWSADRLTTGGALHGGYLMALVDAAGGTCAFYNLPEGAAGTSTIESKTNFFRGVRSGLVVATSTPVHTGRTTIVVQTDLTDDAGKLVTRSLQTQTVLRA